MGVPSAAPLLYQSLSFGNLPSGELESVGEFRWTPEEINRFLQHSGWVEDVPKRMDYQRPLVPRTIQTKRDQFPDIAHFAVGAITSGKFGRISSRQYLPIAQ